MALHPESRAKYHQSLDVVLNAATSGSDQDFLRQIGAFIKRSTDAFPAHALSISERFLRPGLEVDQARRMVAVNLPARFLEVYQSLERPDLLAVMSNLYHGSACFQTDIMSIEEWKATELHQNYKAKMGLLDTILTTYPVPGASTDLIRFCYQTREPEMFPTGLTKTLVEYYSAPFLFAWLFRTGRIARADLEQTLEKLERLSLPQFLLVREVLCGGPFELDQTAFRTEMPSAEIGAELARISALPIGRIALPEMVAQIQASHAEFKILGRVENYFTVRQKALAMHLDLKTLLVQVLEALD